MAILCFVISNAFPLEKNNLDEISEGRADTKQMRPCSEGRDSIIEYPKQCDLIRQGQPTSDDELEFNHIF